MTTVSSKFEVPVFYPSYDEFQDFSSFISSIEARGAHRIGLAKIVPPKGWKARKTGYKQKQIEEKIIDNPIKQEVRGRDGIYSVFNIQQRSIKASSFQKLSSSSRYAAPQSIGNDFEKLEKKYWQSLTSNAPIYGADVSGSFYDEDQTVWNVNNLGTILDDLVTECGMKIQGVNTAYLYFGMWKASFAWHTEDMDLYSINYLHFGAPKQWYVIPPAYGRKFEQFAASRFPALAKRCPAFLRHKMTIISPATLTKESIPYSKMTQYEGEFMITFPYGYHAGFNYGYNCAESTNFALERWIEYGKHSIKCTCRDDMVKISMDPFVYKYQPELYEDWCRGVNLTPHPEDQQISMKKRVSISKTIESFSNVRQQQQHQEHITDERYACIFRNLAKFDKQKQWSASNYSVPLIRAALCRAEFKKLKNPTKSSNKLLCTTANFISKLKYSSLPTFFNGLKQAGKYRENILHGLWNYQMFDIDSERRFNQWLSGQTYSSCSICYFFQANKNSSSISSISPSFLMSQVSYPTLDYSDKILQCSLCHIHIHRVCYEILCLAMNADICDNDGDDDQDQSWLCQRCTLKNQNLLETIDDRCSACLLRGGFLLYPRFSSSFIHAICSIYQAYTSSSSSSLNSCHYCWPFCPLDYRRVTSHVFASCNYPKCSNNFHVTCGLINGCTFQIDEDHSMIHAGCHLHANHFSSSNIDNQSTIVDEKIMESNNDQDDNNDGLIEETKHVPTGTRVLINDNNEQMIGQILKNEINYHYSVDFGDDTYSHDMLAEDILDSDPSKLVIGSNIRIKWTDGTIYRCKYLGRKRVLLYHIQIGNDIRQMQRNEFSLVIQPPSPPPTPCETESEIDSNRHSPSITLIKRQNQSDNKQPIKRKRRRLLLASSSDEDES